MHQSNFEDVIKEIRKKDPRYDREAYLFVRDGLDHTQKTIGRDKEGRHRHVNGPELLEGIREYALSQFGPMTMMVLEEWGIRAASDFGEIVFNMIEGGVLAKTETDTRADFQGGYDFFEAFRRPYMPSNQAPQRAVTPPEVPRIA